MSRRASQAGIDAIRQAMKRDRWTQMEVTKAVGFSRSTLNQILGGQPVKLENLTELCHLLDLQVGQVLEPEDLGDDENLNSIAQRMRESIRSLIQERCGTMRVLDMTQPIGLDKIYTHVNILEKVTGRGRRELAELLRETALHLESGTVERFSSGVVAEPRIPGLEAVEKHSKLMILGKPGAGKTTFLKHLAMQCLGGGFQAHRVPVFITLKDFAEAKGEPDLLAFLHPWLNSSRTEIEAILDSGHALILLDGLDEVWEIDATRVQRQIQQFSERYARNAFVITCRIAAREYIFEKFTDVEVDDFDDAQIADFSHKWFYRKQEGSKAKQFLAKLNAKPPIRELATSPLLLTLLCLVFEDSGNFPTRKWKLYREGFKTLLKWRSQIDNFVDEPFYKALSANSREKLFRQIALLTFEQGKYFDVDTAERLVKQSLSTCLRQKNGDLDIDDLEIDRFLAAIESQHGVLIERAHEVYAFSHLTFHEYFTAREIVETVNASSLETLATHITEPRWREVFLLTTDMLQPADDLLRLMKRQIDEFLTGDETLQQFLTWVDEKARSVNILDNLDSKSAETRAFYFDFERGLPLAEFIDSPNVALDHAFYWAHFRARMHTMEGDSDLDRLSDYRFYLELDRIMEGVDGSDSSLKLAIKNLCSQLPSRADNWQIENDDWQIKKRWWQANGQDWRERLRAVMIKHRNIGHNWQFSDEQRDQLQKYDDAKKLLADCLNNS